MIYTSYYAQLSKIPKGKIPIAISLRVPIWYHGYTCKALAPSEELLFKWHRDENEKEYIEEYRRKLDKINAQEMVEKLSKQVDNKDIVFLCYETPDKFCHRHVLAAWLNENGIPCEELKFESRKEK